MGRNDVIVLDTHVWLWWSRWTLRLSLLPTLLVTFAVVACGTAEKAEVDPVFSDSPVGSASAVDIQRWNEAFGWGNHATAGYLITDTDPTTWDTAFGWGDHASQSYQRARQLTASELALLQWWKYPTYPVGTGPYGVAFDGTNVPARPSQEGQE